MAMNTAGSTAPPNEYKNGQPPMARPFTQFAVGLSIAVCLLTLLGITTELVSIAVLLSLSRRSDAQGISHHSYYHAQPWSAEYWKEFDLSYRKQYRPYIVWRRAPFNGKYINVDGNGLRRVVNPDCSPEAPQIWAFGSSTLWGTGAPDDQTIPSILSLEYSRSGGPVCVTNFGETGWVSTQNVIQLELALKRASRPPDLVLFYDGYADIYAVYQSGNADVHMNFARIRQLVEAGQVKRSSLSYLKETGTYRLITIVMNKVASLKTGSVATSERPGKLDSLAKMTVENYRANMKVVESLSAEYGFQFIAFWNPTIFTGNKPLSRTERSIVASISQAWPELPDLCRKTYDLMFSAPDSHIVSLTDTFDLTKSDTYLDETHVTPDGNRLVALRILEVLRKSDREPVLTH